MQSAPKPPDYKAAAEQAAQGSREVTEQQTWANRPDQVTPWGQQTWKNQQVWDPATQQYINRWQQETTLDPEAQRALDAQLKLTGDRSELGGDLMGRARDEFGSAVDWNKFQQGGSAVGAENIARGYDRAGPNLDPSQRYYSQAGDAIYNQWASRAKPEQERETSALRTRLYNMGLKEGDAAYDAEMQKLGQSQNDAMRQAQYQATIGSGQEAQRMLGMDAATRAQLTGENAALAGFGNQAAGQQFGQNMQASQYQTQLRQQQIAEEMQRRGMSLNEINALISGQQVAMPNMPGFNTSGRADSADYLGAAQMQGQCDLDRFNAEQQAIQGMMSGLGSIGGAMMGTGGIKGMMTSDRRLKTDIELVGKTEGGTNIYRYRYIAGGPPMFGVMADEVPEAATEVNGILFVDYSKVK